MGLCLAEHLDNTRQGGIGTGPHIHRLGGQPDLLDVNQDRVLMKLASDRDWSQGQNSWSVPVEPGSSRRASGMEVR